MSVINQVLIELDRRRASGAERSQVPDHVRALPESGRDFPAGWFAGAGGALLMVVAAAWLSLTGFGEAKRDAASSAIPGPGLRAIAPSAAGESGAGSTGAASRAVGSSGNAVPVGIAGRMSFELSGAAVSPPPESPGAGGHNVGEPIPIASVLEHDPAPAGRKTGSPVNDTVAQPRRKPEPVPGRAISKSSEAGGQGIEKQVRQLTPRELADNAYQKAAGDLHQGRLQEAREGFRAAIGHFPGHHSARQALVALLVQAKQHAEAERVVREGLRLAPEQIGFAMTYARLQVDRGDVPAAIATLQGSEAAANGSPDYLAFLAALLQRQGHHEEAIARFQSALRSRPEAGVWWLGLAISLQASGRRPDAQEAYLRAKAANNLNPELTAFVDQRLRQLQ